MISQNQKSAEVSLVSLLDIDKRMKKLAYKLCWDEGKEICRDNQECLNKAVILYAWKELAKLN